MEISQLIPHVEALIFAADRPLPAADILELLNNALAFLEDRATPEQVEAAIEAIQEKYSSEFYSFSVRQSGGGYQFLTKRDYYQTVAQLNGEKFLKRLSTAALETLAIIAYKQPISKGEIEHIRGVSTDYSITKLLEKELIIISGRSEDLPGKPLLYSTSKAFMDYFGLNSPADLPKLKEVFEEDFVPPTQLTLEAVDNLEVDEETLPDGHFVVTETGELTETTTVVIEDEPSEENTPEASLGDGDGGNGDDQDDPHASGNSAGGDPEMADSGEDDEDELDEDGEIEAMLGDKKDEEEQDEDEDDDNDDEAGDDDLDEDGKIEAMLGDRKDSEESDDDEDDEDDDDDEEEDDDDEEEEEEDEEEEENEGDDDEAAGTVPFEDDPYDGDDAEKADDEEQAFEDADDSLNDEEDEEEDEEGKDDSN
ncbi:SMC-Scp complex subunit ScpB [Chitinophaga caseinilytica]|uniref:SMC-Scp complex subunit ScpB n=1 Tax=Chitinophaga caseinilytica TaxID=2267521 RepID=UPI003C2C10D0